MAKKKDSEKHEDGQRGGKYNKDDADANELENFVDDITDEELLGDVLQKRPKVSDGVDTVIIVDGVPQVNPERFDKLKVVITKIFAQFGKILNDYYPKSENGHTKGYIFIEYEKHESALEAVTQANNYKLDKQHTFLINLFSDYKKYNDIPEKWEAPTIQPFPERPNLQYFLSEPDAFDQYYVYNVNSHIEVWLNSNPQPTKLVEREKWTESLIMWSPLGTYLATLHKQGVVLWGGPNFTNVLKLSHRNVQFVDFSPCEQYLVAYAPLDNGEQKLTIFDIRTGAEKRSFISDAPMAGNVLRWSKDDKYFARIGHNTLSVYETPSFGLLDKKSITVNGIRDFSWSPRDNVLAYWVAEDKDVPARVVLLEIPSRKEIRANNLFNVADCKIHWQKAGDYLCVKVDRYAKIKREKGDVKYSGMYFNFEIFHMREKNIPVDSVEIKEPIHAFAWEPIGSKFAIIHGEPSNNSVSFYNVKSGQAPVLLKKLDKHFCSHLFWSPAGQYIVIAEIRDSGALEFVDTADFTTMCSTEHYKATDIEWDPTGRFVATGVSSWKTKGDTGYWIWSFQGRILNRFNTNTYCHMQWRPRPPTLLSAKQQKDTKKSLKKYTSQFETKDKMRMTKASKEVIDKRRKLIKEFEEYRSKRLEDWNKQKAERMAIRSHIDTDELDSDDKNVQVEKVKKPKPKSKPKAQKSKARKPKFLSLRDHLAPPPPLLPPSEPTTMQEQENIDVQVACLLEHDNGGPTITDLFAGSSTSNNSSLVVDEAFSPASPSVNWDGMARKALRGREKWVFCKSTVSGTSSSSVSEDLDLFGGGGYSRQGLLLKLDYEEVLTAWSDRGSLYIDGEGPQVVPELRQQFEDDSIISNVFVEVGNGGVWRVPEMEVEKEKQVKEGDRGSREAKVLRYKEKRQNRLFAKRIRYEVRKLNAEKRPRIKGRFVKRVEDI